jgi:small subunit ribosomal protein S4
MERRDSPPGMHSWRRGRLSDYGVRLREKQKCKRYYGVLERQFSRLFKEAQRRPQNTGEELLAILESRLDNVFCRLGLAVSRNQARQMIVHGHVKVNGKRVDVPSCQVKPGDVISVSSKEKVVALVKANIQVTKGRGRPSWIELDEAGLSGKMLSRPTRDEVSIPIQEQLIIELMSR